MLLIPVATHMNANSRLAYSAQFPPAIAASVDRWHELVAARDLRAVSSLLHPNVVLRSPVSFKPFSGIDSVARVLSAVSEVLTDFRYEREFVSMDGHSAALEFSASVGALQLKGVDLFRFDDSGAIVELEVMVRPFNALQALGGAMASRLGVSRTQIFLASWLARLRKSR